MNRDAIISDDSNRREISLFLGDRSFADRGVLSRDQAGRELRRHELPAIFREDFREGLVPFPGGRDSHFSVPFDPSSKISSADQFEEFQLPLPDGRTEESTTFATLRRESLKSLMVNGDADTVFDRYYESYIRCFTNPDEVESKEDLRQLLEVGKGDWDISVITLGPHIIAGYHTKLANIKSHEMGLFSIGDYLWTDKGLRRTGLGKILYTKTMELRQSQGAIGHFGEIRDINLLPTTELVRDARAGTTANQRIGFWKSQQRMVLDAPWVQPPLGPGKKEVDFYMLTMSALSHDCPMMFPRDAYLDLWKRFYPRHTSTASFESLKQLTEDTPIIRLIPIDQPRTFIRKAREWD